MKRALATFALACAVAACASGPAVVLEPAREPAAAAEPTPVIVAREPAIAPESVDSSEIEGVVELRAALAHVQALDPSGGRLWIDFAAAKELDDAELARLLEPVKGRAAHLGLARTKVGPITLSVVAAMPKLDRLDLSDTSVDSRALAELGAHSALETLVLVRTRLDASAGDVLAKLPALVTLHAWSSGLDLAALERLRSARPSLRVDSAAVAPRKPVDVEAEVKLVSGRASPAPSAAPSVDAPRPVNTACPVSGTAVNVAYAIVFEGRVVAFCCANCPTKFWADPEAYRSKLSR